MESISQLQSDETIKSRWLVNVKFKPYTDGKEITSYDEKMAKCTIKGIGESAYTLTDMKGSDLDFKFPHMVFSDGNTQEDTYNQLMPQQVDRFIDGHNVTFLAHGQTGSGKTYTTIAPCGSLTKKGGLDYNGEILPHYGLFPRTAINIFNRLQQKGNNTMTISVVQNGGQKDLPYDMIESREIMLDYFDGQMMYFGLSEHVIAEIQTLIEIMYKVEKHRNTDSTNMNSTSSRTNAIIILRQYCKQGTKVCINEFKFFDMAGSERVKKSGMDSGPKKGNLSANATQNNQNLLAFSSCAEGMVKLKRAPKGGEPPDQAQVPWKFNELTQSLLSIMCGQSYVYFILCMSQAPENGGETWFSSKFGEQLAKVKINVDKPKPRSIAKKIKTIETQITKLAQEIKGLNENQIKTGQKKWRELNIQTLTNYKEVFLTLPDVKSIQQQEEQKLEHQEGQF